MNPPHLGPGTNLRVVGVEPSHDSSHDSPHRYTRHDTTVEGARHGCILMRNIPFFATRYLRGVVPMIETVAPSILRPSSPDDILYGNHASSMATLPKQEARRRLFQQLVDGVSYCHEKDVYYRDLKVLGVSHFAQNIFIISPLLTKKLSQV
jgi:hypothetical protein